MIDVTDVKLFKRHNFGVYGLIFKIFGPKLVATYPLMWPRNPGKNQIKLKNYFFLNFYPQKL